MRRRGQRTEIGAGDTAVSEQEGEPPASARGPIRVLRFRAVRDRTGLSRSTIWRLERRGTFPKHRRISLNAVGWLEEEVDQWIRSCAAV